MATNDGSDDEAFNAFINLVYSEELEEEREKKDKINGLLTFCIAYC